MEAFFTVLGFFILTACLLYITVIIQENGFAPVLIAHFTDRGRPFH